MTLPSPALRQLGLALLELALRNTAGRARRTPVLARRARLGAHEVIQEPAVPHDSGKRAISSARPSNMHTRVALESLSLTTSAQKCARAERCPAFKGGSLRAGGRVCNATCPSAVDDSTPRHPLGCVQPIPM